MQFNNARSPKRHRPSNPTTTQSRPMLKTTVIISLIASAATSAGAHPAIAFNNFTNNTRIFVEAPGTILNDAILVGQTPTTLRVDDGTEVIALPKSEITRLRDYIPPPPLPKVKIIHHKPIKPKAKPAPKPKPKPMTAMEQVATCNVPGALYLQPFCTTPGWNERNGGSMIKELNRKLDYYGRNRRNRMALCNEARKILSIIETNFPAEAKDPRMQVYLKFLKDYIARTAHS